MEVAKDARRPDLEQPIRETCSTTASACEAVCQSRHQLCSVLLRAWRKLLSARHGNAANPLDWRRKFGCRGRNGAPAPESPGFLRFLSLSLPPRWYSPVWHSLAGQASPHVRRCRRRSTRLLDQEDRATSCKGSEINTSDASFELWLGRRNRSNPRGT